MIVLTSQLISLFGRWDMNLDLFRDGHLAWVGTEIFAWAPWFFRGSLWAR